MDSSSILYDCIVVGVGGHGSATLAHLAKAGKKVLGLEQFKPVHAQGSSHGRTRIYRQAYFEDPRYIPLLKRSLELFKELNEYYITELRDTPDHEFGIGRPANLLTMCGGAMIGTPENELVTGVLRSIKEHNLEHKIYTAAQMREVYPTFRLAEDEIAVYEANAGYLMAELCVEAYIAMARQHGAEVRFEEPMLDWRACVLADEGEGVEVRTAQGVYRARRLVLSVGAWAPSLYGSAIPHVPLFIERRVLFWFECDEDKVQDFNNMPIYGWELADSTIIYGFPCETDRPREVKVAFHTPGDSGTVNTAHPSQLVRTVDDAEVEAIRHVVKDKIPGINGTILRTEVCMYTCTKDGHFVIDFHPQNANVVLVSPCSGHGFKFISVVGEIVSELVSTGTTSHDISLFSLAARSAL